MIIDSNVMAGTFPDGRVVTVTEILKLMDRAHIDRAIISSPGTLDDTEENLFLYHSTRKYLDRLIPVGILNPKRSQVYEEYDRINQYDFIAIKFDAMNHGYQPICCSGVYVLMEKIADKYKFVYMTTGLMTTGDPAQWLGYVKKYPQLKFVFLGMGAFDFGYGCVDYAVQFDNIYLETSLQYEIQIVKKANMLLQGKRILFGSGSPVRISEVELIKLNSMGFDSKGMMQITHDNVQQLLN